MAKSKKHSRFHVIGLILPWCLIFLCIFIAFFHIKIRTKDDVTTIEGKVSNISTLAPHAYAGTFVLFSLEGKDYYYQIIGKDNREVVAQQLRIEEDSQAVIKISVINEPLWFNALYLTGRGRVVAIDGPEIHLSLELHNHREMILRIMTLGISILLFALTLFQYYIYFSLDVSTKQNKRKKREHRGRFSVSPPKSG